MKNLLLASIALCTIFSVNQVNASYVFRWESNVTNGGYNGSVPSSNQSGNSPSTPQATNHPPVWNDSSYILSPYSAGQVYSTSIPAYSDQDNDPVTVSIVSGPSGLGSFSGSGSNVILSGIINDVSASGTLNIVIKLTDGKGGETTRTFNIPENNTGNNPASFAEAISPPRFTPNGLEMYFYCLPEIVDADNSDLVYLQQEDPENPIFSVFPPDSNGCSGYSIVGGWINAENPGDQIVNLKLIEMSNDENLGLVTKNTQIIPVTMPMNKMPVVSPSIPTVLDVYFDENVPFYVPLQLANYITDPDNDELVFDIYSGSGDAGASFDSNGNYGPVTMSDETSWNTVFSAYETPSGYVDILTPNIAVNFKRYFDVTLISETKSGLCPTVMTLVNTERVLTLKVRDVGGTSQPTVSYGGSSTDGSKTNTYGQYSLSKIPFSDDWNLEIPLSIGYSENLPITVTSSTGRSKTYSHFIGCYTFE